MDTRFYNTYWLSGEGYYKTIPTPEQFKQFVLTHKADVYLVKEIRGGWVLMSGDYNMKECKVIPTGRFAHGLRMYSPDTITDH